jgi:hypothetical protein
MMPSQDSFDGLELFAVLVVCERGTGNLNVPSILS